MRIGLNLLHVITGEIGGAETWIVNHLAALAQYGGSNQYVVYVTREFASGVPLKANFDIVEVSLPSWLRPVRVFWEQVWLPTRLVQDHIEVVHSFANAPLLLTKIPQVVTVYDVRFTLYPEQFQLSRRIYRTWMVKQTMRKASRVISISQYTKDSMVRSLHADPDKICVVQLPIEDCFHPAAPDQVERFRRRFGLPPKFFLYVSNTYPNKNHVRLLEAFAMFRSGGGDYPLVLRGEPRMAETEVQSAIRRLGLSDAVIRIPRLARKDLPLLYSAATALIYPSLFEGLGIPVLEAMACGCPVIASNVTAIPEVVGDAGLLIDPLDITSINTAMLQMARDQKLRDHYANKGLERAKAFTSAQMANQTLRVYDKVIGSGK